RVLSVAIRPPPRPPLFPYTTLFRSRIRAARRHVERADDVTLARQAALSATPAPTGAEGARGARVAELFREIGLSHVGVDQAGNRSEEHTSELQSRRDLVCRLLLEKK